MHEEQHTASDEEVCGARAAARGGGRCGRGEVDATLHFGLQVIDLKAFKILLRGPGNIVVERD